MGFPKLLTCEQAMDRLTICRSKFYAMIGEGVLPKPVKIGGSSRWVEAEINEALVKIIARRGPS